MLCECALAPIIHCIGCRVAAVSWVTYFT